VIDSELSPEALRRLASTRDWALRGKSRLYHRNQRVTAIDVFFAVKRVYGAVQRIPLVGRAATVSARLARRVAGRRRA
jgi:hypothetical protein